MISSVAVLLFDSRRLGSLDGQPAHAVAGPADIAAIDAAIGPYRRLVVVGGDADLAAVLGRLLRAERLDVEVAYVPRRRTAATRAYRLPAGRRAARRVQNGSAGRTPLIRDETGSVIVGNAQWVPADGPPLHGEAIVDDFLLFDGDVAGVHIEPTRVAAGPAGQGARQAPMDHRARGAAGQHRCRRDPRRRPGAPRGEALDVLSQRRRLAVGAVAGSLSAQGGAAVLFKLLDVLVAAAQAVPGLVGGFSRAAGFDAHTAEKNDGTEIDWCAGSLTNGRIATRRPPGKTLRAVPT